MRIVKLENSFSTSCFWPTFVSRFAANFLSFIFFFLATKKEKKKKEKERKKEKMGSVS